MMMRPRNYSVLNRSIARGVSYALRDNNRKRYKNNKYYKQQTEDVPDISWITIGIGLVILAIFLSKLNS